MYLLDTNVVSELRKPKPHGAVLQWMQDVDVKDLLSYGRIVIEEEALNELLSSQTSFRDNFLVSRAVALLPKRKIEKPANPGASRSIGELEPEEDIEELEDTVDIRRAESL